MICGKLCRLLLFLLVFSFNLRSVGQNNFINNFKIFLAET